MKRESSDISFSAGSSGLLDEPTPLLGAPGRGRLRTSSFSGPDLEGEVGEHDTQEARQNGKHHEVESQDLRERQIRHLKAVAGFKSLF